MANKLEQLVNDYINFQYGKEEGIYVDAYTENFVAIRCEGNPIREKQIRWVLNHLENNSHKDIAFGYYTGEGHEALRKFLKENDHKIVERSYEVHRRPDAVIPSVEFKIFINK